MATVVNFIDVTLRGAAARTVNLASAQILLTASAPAFHVDADGVITPPSITFTATRIDIDAPLTFNCTGGTLTNPTATTVTLAGADVVGSSATVIASATVNGQTYTGPLTISKFKDGKDGVDGDGANLTAGDLKAILEGQITTDQLTAALTSRIGLIDGGADVAGSVTARVKAETDARIAAISQASTDNRTYVQQYTYSQQTINDSFSAFGTNIQASYQGYADNAANGALAAAKSFAQSYSYSKADADSSLTATANQLRSEFQSLNQGAGATVAWVQEYAYSKAQANDAIASATQQLSTTVAGHTTTIETQSQSINGLSGQYSVKVDNNNYVSGFGLSSTPINGVPTSSFIVLADRFAVALPGQPAKYPFAIGKVAGQTTITFNGNIIADGSFTFRDAAGKVLLSVGVPLDPSLAAPGTLNSDIAVGGRNLAVDSAFERGQRPWTQRSAAVSGALIEGAAGAKNLFLDSNGGDAFIDGLGPGIPVIPGRQYVISYEYATATAGTINYSSSVFYTNAGGVVGLPFAPANTGQARIRNEILWTCPNGVTSLSPRFGINCSGYSWLRVYNFKVEEGNKSTGWNPAPEDVTAGITAAQSAADAANGAIPGLNTAIAARLRKDASDTLSGQIALTSQYALLVGDANNGVWMGSGGIFMVQNGVVKASLPISGSPTFAGQLIAAFGTFGAMSIAAGGFIAVQATAFNSDPGIWIGMVNGLPKMSMVAPNGSKILFDPSAAQQIQLVNVGVAQSPLNVSISTTGGNLTTSYSRNASAASTVAGYVNVADGSGNYTYSWSVTADGYACWTTNPAGANCAGVMKGPGIALPDGVGFTLVCTVTDKTTSRTGQATFSPTIFFT